LLPPGEVGSISTLPIAWGNPRPTSEQLTLAGSHLKRVAEYLADLEQRTGRFINVCIEPEPGCVFDTSAGAIAYFQQYLLDGADAERVRRHIRICYDICHASVMFEDQSAMVGNLTAAGIGIGKVQVSSAVAVDFSTLAPERRAEALRQLAAFNEPRYLHQTVVQAEVGGPTVYYEDLAPALAAAGDPRQLTSRWRVHFHVPVYLQSFGQLQTSQPDIYAALEAVRQADVTHFEVETYAWGVLPAELRQPSLAAGIAEEMQWFTLAQQEGGVHP
ncbi:MAG TPA: metabolite traffic protein EboE, partial [Pirellulaceae bacterium]|nr:metabolite traffic protein EboE [Pirellulaceae bacterium]